MLKIWGRCNAINVQKVLWLADELSLSYELIPAGGSFGKLNTETFLAMNPHGHVPVLMDEDETIVWESHTILRYLAARFGKHQFWSAEAKERAWSEQWMDWSQTALQPSFINGIFWAYYRTPEAQRDWTVINENLKKVTKYFLLLNQQLSQYHYLNGDCLSLADIPVGTLLYRYFNLDIEKPVIPHVETWYQQLQTHSAYQQHVMISFEELKGKLSY